MNDLDLRVIVLDDDEDTRYAIGRILGKCGCEVQEASSVDETLTLLNNGQTDVIFSDVRLPGADGGIELLSIVTEQYSHIQMVLMSCAMDAAMRSELMNKGAVECLQKPFFKDTCEPLVQRLRNPLPKTA